MFKLSFNLLGVAGTSTSMWVGANVFYHFNNLARDLFVFFLSFFPPFHASIHTFNKIIFKLSQLLILQECIKWLDAADDGDEKTVCEVNPLRELQVDERCSIKGIIVAEDHWLIQVRTILDIQGKYTHLKVI